MEAIRTKQEGIPVMSLSTLRKLFWVSRPISWPNTSYPFAAGIIVTLGTVPSGELLLTLVIGTLYFMGPYNLLMYGVNDVFDYESDIKNPRKGGVEGMKESRALHPAIMKAAIVSNVPFLVYLFLVSPWPARAVLALSVFAVIAYSLKGLRFKEIPFLDSITSSFHFVSPLLFALTLIGVPEGAWLWLAAFFVWGIASHALGAIQDIIPDRNASISSIATVLGARATLYVTLVCYVAAAILPLFAGLEYWIISLCGAAYGANVLPFVTITDKTSAHSNKAWKRFLWINYLVGAIITIFLVVTLY